MTLIGFVMNGHAPLHPTDQILSDFVLRKLDDTSAESVHHHLEECPGCQRRVAGMSSGTITGPPRTDSVASQSGRRRSGPAPRQAATVPPDLADHPDYHIVRELGRGGMGVVYLARNQLMDRDEVLKVVSKQLLDRKGVLERFLREIRAAARLHHPNIVTAYSAFRTGESIVFAMEYIDGLDLAKKVRTTGRLPVINACYFAQQAALGLQHAHEQGLVHRDIKPANLMLAGDRKKPIVKVLDFGLAKASSEQPVDSGLTGEGQMLGTPDCIAPEQIRDAQSADIRADIYSLGCTLYYLLAGHAPFVSKSLFDVYQAHFSMDARPLNVVRPKVAAELVALVARMMAKDPERRFQTPADVAQALTPFLKSGPTSATPARTEPPAVGGPVAPALAAPPAPVNVVSAPVARPKKGPAEPAAPEPRWERLIDLKATEGSIKGTPSARRGRRPSSVGPSVALAVLILGLLAAWAGVGLKTTKPVGVIVLENLPKDSVILVDGKKITFTRPGVRQPVRIRAVPGQHRIEVRKRGFKPFAKLVIVTSDHSEEVGVRLESRAPRASAD